MDGMILKNEPQLHEAHHISREYYAGRNQAIECPSSLCQRGLLEIEQSLPTANLDICKRRPNFLPRVLWKCTLDQIGAAAQGWTAGSLLHISKRKAGRTKVEESRAICVSRAKQATTLHLTIPLSSSFLRRIK